MLAPNCPTMLRERTVMPRTTPRYLLTRWPSNPKAVVTICLSMLTSVSTFKLSCYFDELSDFLCILHARRALDAARHIYAPWTHGANRIRDIRGVQTAR